VALYKCLVTIMMTFDLYYFLSAHFAVQSSIFELELNLDAALVHSMSMPLKKGTGNCAVFSTGLLNLVL